MKFVKSNNVTSQIEFKSSEASSVLPIKKEETPLNALYSLFSISDGSTSAAKVK